MLVTGLIMVFFTATLLVFVLLGAVFSRKSAVLRRLESFSQVYDVSIGLKRDEGKEGKLDNQKINKKAEGIYYKLSSQIGVELAKTDLPINPREFMIIVGILALVFALVSYLLTSKLLMIVVGILFAVVLSSIFLKFKKNQRTAKLNNQLVETITFISNGLKAGYSFFQTAEMVARDMRPPMSVEFRKMIRQMSLGMTTEEALKNLSARMESQDMDLVVTAILIQRQIGGNLAEILDKIIATIQGRIRLKNDIRVKTAQGKLSGVVLTLLVPGLALLIYIINPQFIGVLFTSVFGWISVIVSLLLQIIGIFFISKIIKIEI